MPVTRHGLYRIMDNVYEEIKQLRAETAATYAPNQLAPFENFETAAKELDSTRERVLFENQAYKHVVGIRMWVKATPEDRVAMDAREPIEKRINDLVNYLLILRGMIEEDKLDSIEDVQNKVEAGLMVMESPNKKPPTEVIEIPDPHGI